MRVICNTLSITSNTLKAPDFLKKLYGQTGLSFLNSFSFWQPKQAVQTLLLETAAEGVIVQMRARIRFYSIWVLVAALWCGPFVALADEIRPPLPRKSGSGPRELLSCSLQVTTPYHEGWRKRVWVDIKNQPVLLGKSENALDLQPVFEGPAIEAIYKNGIIFMASLFTNESGMLRIKMGMYRIRKNLMNYTTDQYYLIPNSIYYAHPIVEQESTFEPGDTFSIEFNRAVGVDTSASYTVMNCQHVKSLNGGVQ